MKDERESRPGSKLTRRAVGERVRSRALVRSFRSARVEGSTRLRKRRR